MSSPTDRVCPICSNGWEPDGDDVMRCRACGGSGFLGPIIPKMAFCDQPTMPNPESFIVQVGGVTIEIPGTTTLEDMPAVMEEAIKVAVCRAAGCTEDASAEAVAAAQRVNGQQNVTILDYGQSADGENMPGGIAIVQTPPEVSPKDFYSWAMETFKLGAGQELVTYRTEDIPPLRILVPAAFEDREAEKAASRKRDVHDLVTGAKTPEQLREENSAFKLTGERISHLHRAPIAQELIKHRSAMGLDQVESKLARAWGSYSYKGEQVGPRYPVTGGGLTLPAPGQPVDGLLLFTGPGSDSRAGSVELEEHTPDGQRRFEMRLGADRQESESS